MQALSRDTLVKDHARLVASVAREYTRPGISREDLEQEGYVGLMIAFERFDPNRGVAFVTFAWWHIRAQINNHVRREFLQSGAAISGQDPRKVRTRNTRLDEPVRNPTDDGSSETNLDRIESSDPSPEELTIYRELLEATADAVRMSSTHDTRMAEIARNRLSSQPKSQKATARRVGVSKQRIQQLESVMLKKLREML